MQPPPPPQVPDAIIPRIIDSPAPPSSEISMIDVALAAFGLTGYIMVAAVIAGLLAGALYIWYRSRRPVSTIEARGGQHNLLRG